MGETPPTRPEAATLLPRADDRALAELGVAAILLLVGVGLVVAVLLSLRLPTIVGLVVGVPIYLALRLLNKRTGAFSGVTAVVDPDGVVRLDGNLAAVQRAARSFTDQRRIGREVLIGIGIAVALSAACVVAFVLGLGMPFLGAFCAVASGTMVEAGRFIIRNRMLRVRTSSVLLDGNAMTALLAAYLHLTGDITALDDKEAGLGADVLLERLTQADSQTLAEMRMLAAALSTIEGAAARYGRA